MRYIFLVTLKQHKYRVIRFPRALSSAWVVSCATARSVASEVRVRNSCVHARLVVGYMLLHFNMGDML